MHVGLRGPKPRISGIDCVNEGCANFSKPGTDSIVSNGTCPTQSGRVSKYICRACGAVFCERQGTALYDIRSPGHAFLHGEEEPPPLDANVVIAVGNCGLYTGPWVSGMRIRWWSARMGLSF
jgi:hypothetical protein